MEGVPVNDFPTVSEDLESYFARPFSVVIN